MLTFFFFFNENLRKNRNELPTAGEKAELRQGNKAKAIVTGLGDNKMLIAACMISFPPPNELRGQGFLLPQGHGGQIVGMEYYCL